MTHDLLNQAYESLRYNRRRTAMTMLGMAWGIATVVLLLAYGSGFGRAIETIFASFGSHVMGVFPGRTSMQAGGNKAGTQIRFTLEDIDRLAQNVPQITHITPEVNKQSSVQYENRTYSFLVQGDYPNVQRIRNQEVDYGRFYSDEDLIQKSRVAVIGSEVKEKLFSGKYPLGESIRINGLSFEVVGVAKPKMQEGDSDINRLIYVPFTTMSDLTDPHYLDAIWLDFEGDSYAQIQDSIRNVLARQYNFKPDDQRAVFVFSAMERLYQFRIITMGLQVLLAFIGTLTLGIGGVGLMNIMLVSVTQRTREIGVEKALGATNKDILQQFLAEALAITFVGGLAGIVLAYLVSFSVGQLTFYSAIAKNAEAADIRLLISPSTVFVSTLILTVVGLISGMVPAIRASRARERTATAMRGGCSPACCQ